MALVGVVCVVLMGCGTSPTARIGLGVVTAAIYIPLAQESESQKDVFGDATIGSVLIGGMAFNFLVGGAMLVGSGVVGHLGASVDRSMQRQVDAENELARLIVRAAQEERCAAARLMMARLNQQNGAHARKLAGAPEVARCLVE